jgi:hypothetical protein
VKAILCTVHIAKKDEDLPLNEVIFAPLQVELKLVYKKIMCLFHPCVHAWIFFVNVGFMHEGLKDQHVIDGIITLWIGFYIVGHISSFNVLCDDR